MTIEDKLFAAIGKNINLICGNKFHYANENHCAHFVSHICDLAFSYNCVEHKGGTKPGANIRVHELFPQCPKVGLWDDADTSKTQLIFVTLKRNVTLATKHMVNIPQKHVGIYHKNKIYHYGNTSDKVVTDTPKSFFDKFQALYDGDQGLFYGWIPGENLLLNVYAEGAKAKSAVQFDIPEPVNGRWQARVVGEPFFHVGDEVRQPSKKFYGIMIKTSDYWGKVYRSDDYTQDVEHWGVLLEVTGACESQNYFSLINTYDRAKFTFGFYQLAAHTPRDNLILLFRQLARLQRFNDYFPDLRMVNGKLSRVDDDDSMTDLEEEISTGPKGSAQLQMFMNYLNPDRQLIDRQEVLQAARLIHWSEHDPEMRRAQVVVSADILQNKMARRYHPNLGLDGRSDIVCAIVADIFHQGRAKYSEVKPILAAANPTEALLTLKNDIYGGRNSRLRKAIENAKKAKKLGHKTYRASINEFG